VSCTEPFLLLLMMSVWCLIDQMIYCAPHTRADLKYCLGRLQELQIVLSGPVLPSLLLYEMHSLMGERKRER